MITNLTNNKILITGGLGFIGHNLTSYLLNNTKYSITIFDNNSIYTFESFQNHFNNDRISYVIHALHYSTLLETTFISVYFVF